MSYAIGDAVSVSAMAVSDGYRQSDGFVANVFSGRDKPYFVHFDTGSRLYMSEGDLVPATLPHGDPVQSPSHYDLPGGIQVIDLIRGESFLRGNLIKYVFRAPRKGNELQDMKKAAEYLKWEIERLENEQSS